jgi:hypothetical protein
VPELQSLLERGEAGVNDVDCEIGLTALQVRLCRMLSIAPVKNPAASTAQVRGEIGSVPE